MIGLDIIRHYMVRHGLCKCKGVGQDGWQTVRLLQGGLCLALIVGMHVAGGRFEGYQDGTIVACYAYALHYNALFTGFRPKLCTF